MALVKSFVFLCLFSAVYCTDCVIDHRTEDFSWEVQLSRDMRAKTMLEKFEPNPHIITSTLNVSLHFSVQDIRFISNEEIFCMNSWVNIKWVDDRSTWDPKSYGGIEKTIVSAGSIWTPGLRLLNTMEHYDFDDTDWSCSVNYDGGVECSAQVTHAAGCSTKLRNWPVDTQSCTLHFGNWEKPSENVLFTFDGMVFSSEYSSAWNIISLVYKTPCKQQFSLTFNLERQALVLVVMIVIPCFVVCVLTLTSLVLQVDNIRLFISCLSLLFHYYILTYISKIIPKHSADVPGVLLFVRSSAVMTLLSIAFTFFLQHLMNSDKPIPNWMTKINDFVLKSKFKFVLWPRWERESETLTISENLSEDKKVKEEWLDFANVLNSLGIVVFVLVYVCILSVYIPRLTTTLRPDPIPCYVQ